MLFYNICMKMNSNELQQKAYDTPTGLDSQTPCILSQPYF